MRSWLAFLLLLPVLSCADSESVSLSEIDSISSKYLEDQGLPGLAVTIAVGQAVVYSKGFGYADLEQKVPVDPSKTRFRVGSTAKSMTAVALGQLVEAGKLDLDAPIQKYLPDYPVKDKGPVTTRQLAGHIAGVRSYEGNEMLISDNYDSVSAGLEIFRDDPLLSIPGSTYAYSSYGFNLISAVIEAVSGEDYLSYMQKHVFGPMQMNQTVADKVVPLIGYRSRYYRQDGSILVNSPWVNNSHKWAGGGFLSTSEDLVRLMQGHLTTEYLQQETIDEFWTAQKTSDGVPIEYGIGWFLRPDGQGRATVGHGGGSVGGTTAMQLYQDDELIIVAITNMTDASLGGLVDLIADQLLED